MALSAITLSTNAQKLPGVQTTSILAPADIKIDGKATEWNNKFQAYNHATQFYYTLANDKDNLYLAIQATSLDIAKRILNGGITLAVSLTGDKKDKNIPSITFPVSAPGNKIIISSRIKPDPITMPAQADSFMRAKNKEMGTKFKTIKTKNISQLDTLISVYNTDNIKVAGLLDINLAYTCEMAIPLKYLKIDKASKFAYHITINAAEQSGISVLNMDPPGSGQRVININTSNLAIGQDATDFWGEYTLAK
jgi:hypothetical protein